MMRHITSSVSSILIILFLLACSRESNTHQTLEPAASIPVSELSVTTTTIDRTKVATTTQFDYSKIDYSNDEPEFLYDLSLIHN